MPSLDEYNDLLNKAESALNQAALIAAETSVDMQIRYSQFKSTITTWAKRSDQLDGLVDQVRRLKHV